MPIGNLSSQVFANIYLDQLDQFIKHKLHVKHYFRYADDFVIISLSKEELTILRSRIAVFLETELKLLLHPNKISIRKFRQGIDFLGYVILPYHRVLRTKTRRRMFRKMLKNLDQFEKGKLSLESLNQSRQSYLGLLKHADTFKLKKKLL